MIDASWLLLLLGAFLKNVHTLDTSLCGSALGMQNGKITDDQISASSYFDAAVNAIYGRAHVELNGGAWCPRTSVHHDGKEYLEVDLNHLHVVTKVEVQGRFGNGKGQEFTEHYKLQYWRPGLENWVTYTDGQGKQILDGNSNTYLAKSTSLRPPIIASRLRFLPYSHHPRTICLRVEIYGCTYSEGIVSYKMADGDPRGNDGGMKDLTYDGHRQDGRLYGGLGQLIDGETGHTNFRVDAMGKDRGYEWVGWKNETRQDHPVEITFEFDQIRNFSALHIYTNNFFTRESQVFSRARVMFSVGGHYYHAQDAADYTFNVDRIFDHSRNVTIKLHNSVAKYVKLQLYFSLRWIMISEVAFDSVPCGCNITAESPPPTIAASSDESSSARTPVIPAHTESPGLLIAGVITLVVIFCLVPLGFGILYYRVRLTTKTKVPKTPPLPSNANSMDARKVTMKMKDLHINMSLNSMSNSYSRANGKLYGHIDTDDEASLAYQEPYKGPIQNPAYYTMNHGSLAGLNMPLKCSIPVDTDESLEYAVPEANVTPPPPFSENYKPIPPPVPLSRPPFSLPNTRNNTMREAQTPPIPPLPVIPPPPEQEYYMAPKMCLASNIQGVTGTAIYASADVNNQNKERTVPEVSRSRLCIIDDLGEGVFGVVQLCELDDPGTDQKRLLAVKSLKATASETAKEDFRQEIKVLSSVEDPNIVRLIGVISNSEPLAMLLEYMDYGDLFQFLKHHICEEGSGIARSMSSRTLGKPPAVSYGGLVYMASQIAAGMKYLESMNLVHRDLAARNCLVGHGLTIKVSDFGMSRPLYTNEYYKVGDGHVLLPIRWMAWESILQGRFSTKSDVWAFGVTLWEILTMARRRPYDELSDEGVLENVSHCYHGDESDMILLPQPSICPREMYDMITACWRTNERHRPPFWEIQMFLKRKNLGYVLDYIP